MSFDMLYLMQGRRVLYIFSSKINTAPVGEEAGQIKDVVMYFSMTFCSDADRE